MGLEITMEEKKGPVIHNPLRNPEDILLLKPPQSTELDHVYNAIYLTRQELED